MLSVADDLTFLKVPPYFLSPLFIFYFGYFTGFSASEKGKVASFSPYNKIAHRT